MTPAKKDKLARAAALSAEAHKLEAEGKYYDAREAYEKSLALHEDEAVREAYLQLMATIGPA
jgi:hypothetical protein